MTRSVNFAGNSVPLAGKMVKVGDKAQDFCGISKDLKDIKLSDFDGKIKIISVFPSIDTPVCSLQAGRFNHMVSELGDKVVLLAVSVDLPFALNRFCGAEGIKNMTIMSDHRALDFGTKYGFILEPLRLLTRGVVVVDASNTVQYVEYVPEVTNEPNYDAALEAVKKLL